MLMLRSRDQHGIDGLVIQHLAKVAARFRLRSDALGFVQAAGVDVGYGHGLDIRTLEGRLEILLPPAATADQPEAHAVTGAEHSRGRVHSTSHERGGSSQNLTYEFAATGHKTPLCRSGSGRCVRIP